MDFTSILLVLAIFLLVIIIQIIIWRFLKPKNQLVWIFSLFLGFPLIVFSTIFIFNLSMKFLPLDQIFAIGLIFFSLSCAYILTFPAIQANAPSLQIIYLIGKSMPKGLKEEEIANHFTANSLITDRMNDLISENLIWEEDNRLYLSPKGRILANIFYGFRKLYGLNTGKG